MHNGKHGRHLEQVSTGVGVLTDSWMLVNYGDQNYATMPFSDLVMSREDWLQLGVQIDMMSLTKPVKES